MLYMPLVTAYMSLTWNKTLILAVMLLLLPVQSTGLHASASSEISHPLEWDLSTYK